MRVAALRARTSDRRAETLRGAEAVAHQLDPGARMLGEPGTPRTQGWEEDLRDGAEALAAAGAFMGEALDAGALPVLTAGHCSICMTTLPAIADRVAGLRVLWIDAHGDFNTPFTTGSGFLGGMCLSAACGRWDAGYPGVIDPGSVVMCGVRDLDPGERVVVADAGVRMAEPGEVATALARERVVVHLDVDVLDPSVVPAQFAAPGGWDVETLRGVLRAVGEAADVVAVEITALEAPEQAAMVAEVVLPLIGRGR